MCKNLKDTTNITSSYTSRENTDDEKRNQEKLNEVLTSNQKLLTIQALYIEKNDKLKNENDKLTLENKLLVE